jgi:surface antigen
MQLRSTLRAAVTGAAVAGAALTGALALGAGSASAATVFHATGRPSTNERSAPSTGARIVGSLPYGAAVDVVCQTTGTPVLGSSIWDRLPSGAYVSDYWVSTPVYGGYTPGLAHCSSATPPAPAPTPTPAPAPAPAPTARATGATASGDQGAPGQCTWWADYEFHVYSGQWPDFTGPNSGDAQYWADNAARKGWTVTSTPEPWSVAVFPPGVNGAGSVGHVAWVTAVSGDHITVSEMDFPHAYQVDVRTIVPASSVRFILAP